MLVEFDIVLIYELGICIALTFGHDCTSEKISLFDGLVMPIAYEHVQ